MKLYIIRHAQSTNNALDNARKRVCDPALTTLGFKQAEIVAQHLVTGGDPKVNSMGRVNNGSTANTYAITHLYCSAMYRAMLTAHLIGEALGLAPEVWLDTHEAGGIFLDNLDGQGKVGYPGKTRPDILAEFPNYILPDEISETGWWTGGFEERADCHGRAIKVASQLRRWADKDENIVLVSHGGFIGSLLKALFNQLPYPHLYFHHYNTGITHIDFHPDDTLEMHYLNRFDHLPAELMS